MRKLGIRLLVLWYWIIGQGPWLVVGKYYDDEGKLRRFLTGHGRKFASLDAANAYCRSRNDEAMVDPLGTAYWVYHELEYKES